MRELKKSMTTAELSEELIKSLSQLSESEKAVLRWKLDQEFAPSKFQRESEKLIQQALDSIEASKHFDNEFLRQVGIRRFE